jgi:histidinol dehydrogenase
VLVIADADANPVFVAADLLSQAEHGPDSQVILLSPSDCSTKWRPKSIAVRRVAAQSDCAQALAQSRLIEVDSLAQASKSATAMRRSIDPAGGEPRELARWHRQRGLDLSWCMDTRIGR